MDILNKIKLVYGWNVVITISIVDEGFWLAAPGLAKEVEKFVLT